MNSGRECGTSATLIPAGQPFRNVRQANVAGRLLGETGTAFHSSFPTGTAASRVRYRRVPTARALAMVFNTESMQRPSESNV